MPIKVRVLLKACDDTTSFVIECTEAELLFLRGIAATSEAMSTHSCQPTMQLLDGDVVRPREDGL